MPLNPDDLAQITAVIEEAVDRVLGPTLAQLRGHPRCPICQPSREARRIGHPRCRVCHPPEAELGDKQVDT